MRIEAHAVPEAVVKRVLHSYMAYQSEERYSAGWLKGLHEELVDNSGYAWLVSLAGGTFVNDTTFAEGHIEGDKFIFHAEAQT